MFFLDLTGVLLCIADAFASARASLELGLKVVECRLDRWGGIHEVWMARDGMRVQVFTFKVDLQFLSTSPRFIYLSSRNRVFFMCVFSCHLSTWPVSWIVCNKFGSWQVTPKYSTAVDDRTQTKPLTLITKRSYRSKELVKKEVL